MENVVSLDRATIDSPFLGQKLLKTLPDKGFKMISPTQVKYELSLSNEIDRIRSQVMGEFQSLAEEVKAKKDLQGDITTISKQLFLYDSWSLHEQTRTETVTIFHIPRDDNRWDYESLRNDGRIRSNFDLFLCAVDIDEDFDVVYEDINDYARELIPDRCYKNIEKAQSLGVENFLVAYPELRIREIPLSEFVGEAESAMQRMATLQSQNQDDSRKEQQPLVDPIILAVSGNTMFYVDKWV